MEQESSSNAIWYTLGIVVIIALVLWYFFGNQAPTVNAPSTAIEQTQIPPLSNGNTIADITSDLNQTPDDTTALTAAASASAQVVQSF